MNRYNGGECISDIRNDLKPLKELCLECYSELDKSVQLDELAGLDKSARLGELDELDWIYKIVFAITGKFQNNSFQFQIKFAKAYEALEICSKALDNEKFVEVFSCAIDDIDLIIEKNARQKEK